MLSVFIFLSENRINFRVNNFECPCLMVNFKDSCNKGLFMRKTSQYFPY